MLARIKGTDRHVIDWTKVVGIEKLAGTSVSRLLLDGGGTMLVSVPFVDLCKAARREGPQDAVSRLFRAGGPDIRLPDMNSDDDRKRVAVDLLREVGNGTLSPSQAVDCFKLVYAGRFGALPAIN